MSEHGGTLLGHSPATIAAIFEEIVAASPIAMATTAGATHLIRYANPAFCRLSGRTPDAIIDHPLVLVLPELQEQGTTALLDRAYKNGVTARIVDLRPANCGSGWTHATYTVWPVLGEDRQPLGVLVEVSDTTDPVRARERAADDAAEIRDVNQRLLVAGLAAQEHADTQTALNAALRNLLEARERAAEDRESLLEREHVARDEAEAALRVRDEFLAIASHELRTPLTTVKGTAQLALRALEHGVLDLARAVRQLRSIDAAANRLEQLLVDLMDVARMRSDGPMVRREPMDVAALVGSLARHYADGVGNCHRLVSHLPHGPVLVDGDHGRLEQVLDNMLSNAVKYTPVGGEIVVRLEEVPPGQSFNAVATGPSGGQNGRSGVVLSVTDTGIGMPLGEQGRIFEPFGRATNATRHAVPGMGLGLYICRQIVEAHGGRMWAESAGEDLGTTLGVWLPRRMPTSTSEPTALEQGHE
jgi:PAS domain S-box-containing protein